MTAKPPLSHRITIILCPDSTDEYRSLFIIRYEPSPTNTNVSPSGASCERAIAAPHPPEIS